MTVTDRVNLHPPRQIDELRLYERIGWDPHEGQKEVICSYCRNKVVAAGRRFGKSEVGGHKLFQEALNTRLVKGHLEDIGKRREFWIVGPSYTDSEKEFRVMWNELSRAGLREHFDKPGSYNNPEQGDMHLSLWGGRFMVHAKSERHPESLVGEGLSGVVMAEAAKLKERTWNKLIRPTLADFMGWSLMTSTPEGKNWFYEMWKRGQDPNRPDWASWRMPSWVNPHVYPMGATDDSIMLLRRAMANREMIDLSLFNRLGIDPEIGELAADLTEESFNQEIAALFTEFVGRVFKGFDEDVHVGDFTYNPGWKLYAASDAGFTNPAVWLLIQVDPFDEQIQVLDEVYTPGLTADEFAEEVKAKGLAPSGVIKFYPDPADPAFAKTLSEKLRIPIGKGTGGELKHRLDAIRGALKERNTHLPEDDETRKPTLMFDRRCTNTINDFLNYRYPEKRSQVKVDLNSPELPMKKDDHGPEALGRFFAGHYGHGNKTHTSKVRQSAMASGSQGPSDPAGLPPRMKQDMIEARRPRPHRRTK